MRDEIGYSTLVAWIYRKRVVGPETLRALTDRWLGNLTKGIGERDTDRVFRRSFSALALSVIVGRDDATPFLMPQEFQRIKESALTYLNAEHDVRGYDADKGWIHSAAHTADLLKFIGRSRYLETEDPTRMLDAIARKLAEAGLVFTHGEDERFARAVLSLINRPDFDRNGFQDAQASEAATIARDALRAALKGAY
jgi:hypothetical protein